MSIIQTALIKAAQTVNEYFNDILDAILDITLVLISIITLSGCAATQPIQENTYHPAWPTPYKICDVDWKVIVEEDQPYVALSYDDNLNLATCNLDVIRYIKEINTKFCHYRPTGDTRCATFEKEKT
jgi:hypothetical protein